MSCATVPKDHISRPTIDFYKLQTAVLEPREASVRVDVHFVGPSEATLFVAEEVVVLLADEVATFEDDQAAVVVAAWKEIDKALNTPEPRALWVLKRR